MIKETRIEGYNELIDFLRSNDLTVKQTKQIIHQALKVLFIMEYKTKEDLIDALEVYWDKWGNSEDKGIFGDLGSLDVED